jgi:small conductance mechanosensitive channel
MAGLLDELPFLQNISNILIIKFFIALVILLIGFIIAKILGKLLYRILHEIELNSIVRRISKSKFNAEQAASVTLTYIIYFLTIIIALNQVGLTTTVLNMLSGAILVIIIISIFLSIKDSVPNIMVGLSLIKKGDIQEGDYIKTKDVYGRVESITLTEVQLVTRKGDTIHIPNSLFAKTEYTIRRSKPK